MKKLLTFLLASLAFVFSQSSMGQDVMKIEMEPFSKKVNRVGQLDFFRTYKYSFKSSGALKELTVEVGEAFTEDKILACVDTDDLSSELNQLLAEKAYVNQEVKRLSKLQKVNAVSASELESFKSRSSQLKARIIRVRDYLAASVIEAPFDGVVINKYTDIGEWIGPGQPVLEVAPVKDNLVVSVAVQDHELIGLNSGKTLTLVNNSDQKQYAGTIKTVSSTPNVNTGLFQVQLALDSDKLIPIGTLFSVELESKPKFVFKVPAELASLNFNQTATVQVLNDSQTATTRRFPVVSFDVDYVYLDALSESQLVLVK